MTTGLWLPTFFNLNGYCYPDLWGGKLGKVGNQGYVFVILILNGIYYPECHF